MAILRHAFDAVTTGVTGTNLQRADAAWASERAFGGSRSGVEALVSSDETVIPQFTESICQKVHQPALVGLEALDVLNIGVAVTSSSRQLLFANEIAQRILTTRDGLEVTAQGVLDTRKRSNPSLKDLMQQAAQTAMSAGAAVRDSVVAVERSCGKRPLTLMVRSVREPLSAGSGGPAVLVFVLDPERPVRATEAALRQLYGFTAREAHLANLLMEGQTLEQCCDHLNIRLSTARMHLGGLFAKTGVQRQGPLISLLLKSLGMVCIKSDVHRSGPAMAGRDLSEVKASRELSSNRSSEMLTASLEALDLLDIGVVATNSFRQLLFANQIAEHILSTRDGLELTANRVVEAMSACSRPLGPVLQQVVQTAKSGASESKDAILAIQRPDGKRPLMLLIRAVTQPPSRLGPNDLAVLIFVFDPSGPVPATEAGLRQLYGLTACEARIGTLLMEGKTLDDCCDDLDIRPSTARMHLGNLFAKTGVQRQGQLISLFLKSFVVLRSEGTASRLAS